MREFKKFTLTIFLLLLGSFLIGLLINDITEKIKKDIPTEKSQPTTQNTEIYILLKIIDGDTIKVKNRNNEIHNIRMIGLDAPEKSTTRYGYSECFGEEASNHLTLLLSGINEIKIEFDSTQTATDKYGRLLGYVLLSGLNINKKMIEDGYGFEYTYNLPYKYQKEFKKAEKYARENNLGLRNKNTCNGERKEID